MIKTSLLIALYSAAVPLIMACTSCTQAITSCTHSITSSTKTFAKNMARSAEDPGPVATDSYTGFGPFDRIEASSGFDVVYTVGDERTVNIEVTEFALEYVEIGVKDGCLKLDIDRRSSDQRLNNIRLKATVAGPEIKSLHATSGAQISVESPLTLQTGMELTATSGADINIEDLLVCENLTVSVTSGADIKVDGVTAKSVTVTSTSGSDADIYSINTNLVTAESTSGSGIFLEGAAKEVDLTANSASNIRASGLRAERGTASANSVGDIVCNVRELTKTHSSMGRVKNRRN